MDRPEAKLFIFLQSAFTPTELRLFFWLRPPLAPLVDDLPPADKTSDNEYTYQAVEALFRHGLVNLYLFKSLEDERPNRSQDIHNLSASLFKLYHPDNDVGPTSAPAQPSDPDIRSGADELDDLVYAFLRRFSRWGFNVTRICGWGGEQPGYARLAEWDRWAVFSSLERLRNKGLVKTFLSKRKRSVLYKVVTSD